MGTYANSNDTRIDLACLGLHDLFMAVGWSDGSITLPMLVSFIFPFINSHNRHFRMGEDKLIGC